MNAEPAGSRAIGFAIAASAVGVFLFVLLLPPLYATSDEAKYIGLGYNILAGKGLVTDFGASFLNHSPLWPLVLATPQATLGIEGLTVGHLLNAVAAAATVVFTGLLAYRVRPVAGAVAAIAMLGLPYVTHLSRTAGLDMPAVAFSLGYLWLAMRAIDRGSVPLGLLAGLLFGVAFLIKETALPFLPVPYLAALTGTVAITAIARVGGAVLAAAAVTTSWWFVIHGVLGGTVYRLGTPAWTLVPLALLVVILVVLGLRADAIAARLAASGRTTTWTEAGIARTRAIVAWGVLALWIGGQLFVFARAAKLGGAPLIRLAQLLDDAHVYRVQMSPVIAFGIGALLALPLLWRSASARALFMATLAWVPLLLLVLGIGETPRHYMADVAVLIALASAGWVAGVESAARGDRRWLVVTVVAAVVAVAIAWAALPGHRPFRIALVAGVTIVALLFVAFRWFEARPAGARVPRGLRALAGVGGVLLVMFVVAGVVTGRTEAARSVQADRNRAAAVHEISAWISAHAPPGSAVAVGHGLGYELAMSDRDRRYVRIGPVSVRVDRRLPTGLRWSSGKEATDVIRLDAALHRTDTLDAFGAGELGARIKAIQPAVWVESVTVPPDAASAPTLEMLDATPGMTRLQAWRYPGPTGDLIAVAYGVDPAAVTFDDGPLYATPRAVKALATELARSDGRAAADLLDRLVIVPEGPAADEARVALAAVAAHGGATP